MKKKNYEAPVVRSHALRPANQLLGVSTEDNAATFQNYGKVNKRSWTDASED